MTVDISKVYNVYTVTRSNGGESYPITFPYTLPKYVKVYKVVGGVQKELVFGSDYTVNSGSNSVTIYGSIPIGSQVVVYRLTDLTQEIDWVEGQAIYSPDIEEADDKLTHIVQELAEQVNRSVKITRELEANGVRPEDRWGAIEKAHDETIQARNEGVEARDVTLAARDVTIETKNSAIQEVGALRDSSLNQIGTLRDSSLQAMQNARITHLATLQAETSSGLSSLRKTIEQGKHDVSLEADKAIALAGQVGAVSKLAIGEENVEAVFRTRERIRAGDIVNLGSFAYFVGRNTLRLNWEGVELFKGISYDEIGEDGQTSSQVKIYKDIPENQLIRAWNVSSNLSLKAEEVAKNTEEVRRNKDITTNAASEAEASAQRSEEAAIDSEKAAQIARDYRFEIMMTACLQNKGRLNMVPSLEDYKNSPNGWYVLDEEEDIPALCAQPLLSFNNQPDAPNYADYFYVLAGEMDCNHPDDIVIPSTPNNPSNPNNPSKPNNPTNPSDLFLLCGSRYAIPYQMGAR